MDTKNVYFIIGTSYAGKSTLVKNLAKKHDGIALEENYHDEKLPELSSEEFPNLTYTRNLEDWHEFIRRTPDEYVTWINNVKKECEIVELGILEELLENSGFKKIYRDEERTEEETVLLAEKIFDIGYVVDKAYIKEAGGTCFYEFAKGKYDFNDDKSGVWREDSVYIKADLVADIRLNRLFSLAIEDYDYTGINSVDRKQWGRVLELAAERGGEWNAVVRDLSDWVEENFSQYDEFTIIGM